MSLFSPKTVAGALAPLHKIASDLEAVVASRDDSFAKKLAMIEHLQAQSDADFREARDAQKVIQRLQKVLEGE